MAKPSPQLMLKVVTAALEEISVLTKTKRDDEALGVLRIIEAIVEVLQGGLKGKVAPKDVEKALASLRESLQRNHQHAMQAIDDKFDKG